MTSYKRKMILTAIGAMFIAIFGFTSISAATNENSEHDERSVMKKDKDGRASKEAFMQHHEWMFEKSDANKDGFLNKSEMREMHKMEQGMHKRFEEQIKEQK